jgi:hypothetical protein
MFASRVCNITAAVTCAHQIIFSDNSALSERLYVASSSFRAIEQARARADASRRQICPNKTLGGMPLLITEEVEFLLVLKWLVDLIASV